MKSRPSTDRITLHIASAAGLTVPEVVLSFLIPCVTRHFFALHGRRGQHRGEVIELWDLTRAAKDLWLEVAVRHQFGIYLSAPSFASRSSTPPTSRSLIDLSELWLQLHYDASTRTVWCKPRYARLHRVKPARIWRFIAYFALAALVCFFGVDYLQRGPELVYTVGVFCCGHHSGGRRVRQLRWEDAVKIARNPEASGTK